MPAPVPADPLPAYTQCTAALHEARRLQAEVCAAVDRGTLISEASNALAGAIARLERTASAVEAEHARLQGRSAADASQHATLLQEARQQESLLAIRSADTERRHRTLLRQRDDLLRESNAALRRFGNERDLMQHYLRTAATRRDALHTQLHRATLPEGAHARKEGDALQGRIDASQKHLRAATRARERVAADMDRVEGGRQREAEAVHHDVTAVLSGLQRCNAETDEMRDLLRKVEAQNAEEIRGLLPAEPPLRALCRACAILVPAVAFSDSSMLRSAAAAVPRSLDAAADDPGGDAAGETPFDTGDSAQRSAGLDCVLEALKDASRCLSDATGCVRERFASAAARRETAELMQQELDARRGRVAAADADAVRIGEALEDTQRQRDHFKRLATHIEAETRERDAAARQGKQRQQQRQPVGEAPDGSSAYAERRALAKSQEFVERQRAALQEASAVAAELRAGGSQLEAQLLAEVKVRKKLLQELRRLKHDPLTLGRPRR